MRTNYIKKMLALFLTLLMGTVVWAQTEEEPAVPETPYFYFETSHNGLEEDGKLSVKVYLAGMTEVIGGGSFGIRFSEKLGGFSFDSEYPYYEPFDTLDKHYHFFHFMQNDGSGPEESGGIDATGGKEVLICTYHFEMAKSVYDRTPVTTAVLDRLLFDKTAEYESLNEEARQAIWKQGAEGSGYYQGIIPGEEQGRGVDIGFQTDLPEALGVSVRGYVISYDPKKETVIQLIDQADPVLVYEGKIEAEAAGKGERKQAFEVSQVPPGVYTLRISKQSHLPFLKETVVVQSTDLELKGLETGLAEDESDTARLVCGDVDQDGYIKYSDRNQLLSWQIFGRAITSLPPEYQEKARLCDLDGDGYVKMNDLNIMMSGKSFGKGTVRIP